MRKLKLLLILGLLGLAGLTGFAYFGDIAPEPAPRSVPVTIDVE